MNDPDDDSGWRDYAEDNPLIASDIHWNVACGLARGTVARMTIYERSYILGTRYGGAVDCEIYEELRAHGLLDESGELTYSGRASKWVLENVTPPYQLPRYPS